MNTRLLLDGCSFTWGLNLPKEQTLEHLFLECGYEVKNLSRNGKSNQAIALSLYERAKDYDVILAGWTFSARWYLRYHEQNFDFLASRENIELPQILDADEMEQSYKDLHQSLYSLIDITHWNTVSDMLIDTSWCFLRHLNKKIVFFSWENREVSAPLYYPHIPKSQRLPCGHLNAEATSKLFNNLTLLIEQ